MSRTKTAAILLLALVATAGMVLPASAITGAVSQPNQAQTSLNAVSADVGQQLSTILAATTDEVRSEADSAAFEQRFNQTNATARAEAVAERADELGSTASELRSEYDLVTESYRAGEIDSSTYVQRIAVLSTRASTVDANVDRLSKRATQIPAAERRAFNVTDEDLAEISDSISPLSGQTAMAILSEFTGEGEAEIEIESNGGIEIEVSSEDGEQSRQLERPRDGNSSYDLTHAEALDIAADALSEQDGEWVMTSSETDDGAYKFEFTYYGAGEGEAEVSVDGQTGTVFELEESIEFDDEDDDNDDEQLAVQITGGEPGPGANVTLTVTADGEPVEGATVVLNDETVGTTDANGTIDVTLPTDEADIEVTKGDAESELEFEFEGDGDDRSIAATADITNGTVTVSVTLGDEPLEGAQVAANGESAGTTGVDGTASFPLPAGEELEIDIAYNDREAELEYDLEDDDGKDLSVSVTEGEPGPGANVTLTVTADGEPVEGATVVLNDETVGTTDANGTIDVTLPTDEVEIDISHGDAEDKLEFEFEEDSDEADDSDEEDSDEADDSDEEDSDEADDSDEDNNDSDDNDDDSDDGDDPDDEQEDDAEDDDSDDD